MDFTSGSYLLAQLFGLLAMLVFIVSQQCKKRETLLTYFIVGNLLNAVHFLLLNALTGAVMATIGAVRFGIGIISTSKYWLAVFILINTVATYFVFEGWLLSGTAYLSVTCMILSGFIRSDYWMRIAIIAGTVGCIVYGILIGSIISIIANTIFLISSSTGWYRHVYHKGT